MTFLAVRVARHLRSRPAAPPAPVPLGPPDVRALAALDELAAAGLPLQPHYFRLSEIVRGYLQEVGGVPALDMTSSELVAALDLRPVPGLSLPVLHAWLERGDVVRYANLFLVDEEVVADLEEARILIRDVAAALAPPPAEAAAG